MYSLLCVFISHYNKVDFNSMGEAEMEAKEDIPQLEPRAPLASPCLPLIFGNYITLFWLHNMASLLLDEKRQIRHCVLYITLISVGFATLIIQGGPKNRTVF